MLVGTVQLDEELSVVLRTKARRPINLVRTPKPSAALLPILPNVALKQGSRSALEVTRPHLRDFDVFAEMATQGTIVFIAFIGPTDSDFNCVSMCTKRETPIVSGLLDPYKDQFQKNQKNHTVLRTSNNLRIPILL